MPHRVGQRLRGRLQALSIVWDSRSKVDGGQRWYHLYPDEPIRAGDELHWTGLNQNWNFMCADCHSTNLQKNYDLETDTYATTWNEISHRSQVFSHVRLPVAKTKLMKPTVHGGESLLEGFSAQSRRS